MPVITWKECYETKIISLDKEHQRLVELINQLYEAIRQKRSEEVMLPIFDQLLDYTKQHFAHEEEVLEEYSYPDLEQQREQHRKLTEQVSVYRQQLASENMPEAKEIMNFLRTWLLQHIVEYDLQYGPYLDSRAGRFIE